MNDIPRPLPPILPIDRSLRLPDDQYVKEETPKSMVCIHHTVGGSARSTFNWWIDDPARIGTAYIIERDGTIFEVFDPKYWCWHLGIKSTAEEKRSIGIELASEGGLTRSGNYLYSFDRVEPRYRIYNIFSDQGKYYNHGSEWRGYQYFDAYEPEQLDSLFRLCVVLGVDFDIPWKTPADHFTTDRRRYHGFEGFIGHTHIRRDKSDPHPGFPWDDFVEFLNLELV